MPELRFWALKQDSGEVIRSVKQNLDGFSGTGMTGVGASSCTPPRNAILFDLSPAAAFISNFYNSHVDPDELQAAGERLLVDLKRLMDPYYTISEAGGRNPCVIESVVWSTVFTCPACGEQVAFWDIKELEDGYQCPSCKAVSRRGEFAYVRESFHDPVLRQTRSRNLKRPVQIVAKLGKKRLNVALTAEHVAVLSQWPQELGGLWHPHALFLGKGSEWGDTYRAGYHHGYEYIHDFYFPRTLLALATLRSRALGMPRRLRSHMLAWLTSVAFAQTHLYKYRTAGGGQPSGNNLYIPALIKEQNILSALRRKLADLVAAERVKATWRGRSVVSCASSTKLAFVPDASVDYVFVDPPFGANIMYSESSHLWESWLQVRTNQGSEAIMNVTQRKGLPEYQSLMEGCFREFHRVIKPGRWMTVEFHNSQNAVWACIQEALGRAGFVVADVRTLDKQQGTFKQVTSPGAVRDDLIISAYRPNGGLEARFTLEAGTVDGAWAFTRTHLGQLPVFVKSGGEAEIVAERQSHLLFDRMVAFHVQRGVSVPIGATEYYAGLEERFSERDGMYFLPDQAAEYDRKRSTVKEVKALELIPRDEESAIQWLRQELRDKPRTFQDLQPHFMRAVSWWNKHERQPELSTLLSQNCLCYDGSGEVPNQIHAYLSSNFKELRNKPKDDAELRSKGKDRWYVPDPKKAGDMEKLRERALLKEFEEYRTSKAKTLKVFRVEAMRAGFKAAYDKKDYATIVETAEKLPETVLQEDEKLLMYYDVASMRLGSRDGKSELF